MKSETNYHAGLSAEAIVVRDYESRGFEVLSHRWRGRAGEIDLVFRTGEEIVFVEVKKSKTHARAFSALQPRQMDRLATAATEFLDGQPNGPLTECRFDVAAVDSVGRVDIVENAITQ